YIGHFAGGLVVDGLVGESFQVAGANPFAAPDIANTGAFSGLQTARSHVVSRLALEDQHGHSLTARSRFSQSHFSLNRGEIEAGGPIGALSASLGVVYLRNLASTNGTDDSFVVRGAATTQRFDDWRLFGSAVYDI